MSPDGHSYRTYAPQADPVDCDDELTQAAIEEARLYPANAKPVFIGHYWLIGDKPDILVVNSSCIYYIDAKGECSAPNVGKTRKT